jgi:CHAT domain-containing protein/Tfp pilus assembly protein PilF
MKKRTRLNLTIRIVACLLATQWLSASQGKEVRTLAEGDSIVDSSIPETTYQFFLARGSFVSISSDTPASVISFVFRDPRGQVLREIPCWYEGEKRILDSALASGFYNLTLRLCTDIRIDPFRVSLTTAPNTTNRDRLRIQADRLAFEADALISEYRETSTSNAVAKYKAALQAAAQAGDDAEQARILNALGPVSADLGEDAAALDYLSRALLINKTPQDQAATLLLTAAVTMKSDLQKARAYAERALELSRTSSDHATEARGLHTLADILYDSGNQRTAIDYLQQAIVIWHRIGNISGEARSELLLGHSYNDLSELETAESAMHRALDLFNLASEKRGKTQALLAIAVVHRKTGEKQQALNLYQQARQQIEESGDIFTQAVLYNSLSYTYSRLGDLRTALDYEKMALAKHKAGGFLTRQATALGRMGGLYLSLGDFQNALTVLEQSLAIKRSLSNKRWEAYDLRNIGVVQEAMGKTAVAEDYFERALAFNRESGDKRQEAYTLTSLAHVRETSGRTQDALAMYRQALEIGKATEDPVSQLTSLYRIARCEMQLNNLNAARNTLQTGLPVIERLRDDVASYGLRASYFASVRDHYELYIDVLMQLHDYGLAFEISEKSRARTLIDNLGEARIGFYQNIDNKLMEHEKALRAALDAKTEQYTQLLSQGATGERLELVRSDTQRLETEYDQLQADARRKNPALAAIKPEPDKLADIQAMLGDDTTLLEYTLGDERSYAWALTRGTVSSYTLPGRPALETAIQQVRTALTARAPLPNERPSTYQNRVRAAESQYSAAASQLSRWLLLPAAAQLNNRRIVIVAEGMLQYIPFAALPDVSDESAQNPLIVAHEVLNLPSASTLALLRKTPHTPADRTLAVFADPVFRVLETKVSPKQDLAQAFRSADAAGNDFELPRLPGSRKEAEAILAFAPEAARMGAFGLDATRAAAMSPDLARYRIVHFATHALVNDEQPELSGIVLSMVDKNGKRQNGLLRLRDIYSLKLSADLVVLSACNTALGKDVKGEGLIGMVRGFMYSGTQRVIASLWKVDDDATAELMTEFYHQLLERKLSPAAALRQAQIAQLQKKSRQAPFYWASFQLMGEWNW